MPVSKSIGDEIIKKFALKN